MASYRRSRLPFARPQSLQTLQKSAQLRRQKVPQQAQHAPRPQAKATTRPQQWLKGTPRPQQWLLIGVSGCRLPGLKPSKPPKSSKSPPNSAGKRYPNKLNTRHARRQKPPQGHSNGSRAPPGRSNGFFYRRSRLLFARPQTLQTLQTLQKSAQLRREKVPQQAQGAPRPQAKATTRPQQWLKGTPRPQQWLLIGVQGCRLPGLKPSKPSKSPPSSAGKRYPNKPNTRHARRQKPPQGHSNGSRAPHGRSNGFFYRRSRLPFARPETLQTLQKSAQLRRQKVPQQAQHAPRPQAKATTRPQQWLKGTPRPQQWLLIGVQGCRLPGLKASKPSKSPPSSAGKRYPNKPNTRHSRTQKPPQGHSNS